MTLPRFRRKKLLGICVGVGVVFCIYQVMCFIILSDDSSYTSRVHPRDIVGRKKDILQQQKHKHSNKEVLNVIVNDQRHSIENKYAHNSVDSLANNKNSVSKTVASQHMYQKSTTKHSKVIENSNIKNIKTNVKEAHELSHVLITRDPPVNQVIKKTQDMFMCIKSQITIDISKVNDNYCDCPEDGSDEPLTNACEKSVFRCTKHTRGYPTVLPAGFVNDGICDCCDGSDEWAGNTPLLHTLPEERQNKLRIHQTPCKNLCGS